jgi:hypothetical protein
MFGSAAATSLAKRARADLANRLSRVLRDEAERFSRIVGETIDHPDLAGSIDSAARSVEDAAAAVIRG